MDRRAWHESHLAWRLCKGVRLDPRDARALPVRDPDAEEGQSEAGRGAGALARVPRQRSCADASVLVSQPQAARKRQKRAAAREMTWPTRTCVTVEQFMRGPV